MTKAERRQKILKAAREVYAEAGGMSAGLRPVASKAGVTTGAIYAVFDGKEDIYAALLKDSLATLAETVIAVARAAQSPREAAIEATLAFHDYYLDRQFDYALGLYQFERDGRTSLGEDRDAELNAELDRSMAPIREALAAHGDPDPRATAAMMFAASTGALAMRYSKRDRTFGVDARGVLVNALDRLVE